MEKIAPRNSQSFDTVAEKENEGWTTFIWLSPLYLQSTMLTTILIWASSHSIISNKTQNCKLMWVLIFFATGIACRLMLLVVFLVTVLFYNCKHLICKEKAIRNLIWTWSRSILGFRNSQISGLICSWHYFFSPSRSSNMLAMASYHCFYSWQYLEWRD